MCLSVMVSQRMTHIISGLQSATWSHDAGFPLPFQQLNCVLNAL